MSMKTFLPIAFLLFSAMATHGQSLKKYPISNSGCSLYNYCESKYKIDYSEDSSKVYTGECVNGDITYGVICVKLLRQMDDLTMAEDLMIAYVDYLKSNFEIKKTAGYGKGHRLNKNEKT